MKYLKVIEELNQEMFDKHGETVEQWFYSSNGFVHLIGFGEITLWNSQEDDRKCIENDKEELKPYLKKKLKEYGENLLFGDVPKLLYDDLMKKIPSNPEIYKWLKENKYQTELGEQEYIMLYELDIPKILKDFIKYITLK